MSAHVDIEDLSAYLDAELDVEDEANVREHLAGCADCQHAVDELRALDRLARAAADPAPRDDGTDLATRVRARLLAERSGARRGRGAWLPAAAGVAAALLLPWLLLQREREIEPVTPPAPSFERPLPPPAAVAESTPAVVAVPEAPPVPEQKDSAPPVPVAGLVRRKTTSEPQLAGVPEELAGKASADAAAPPPSAVPPAAASAAQSRGQTQADTQGEAAGSRPRARSVGLVEAANGGLEEGTQGLVEALATRQATTAEDARRWREDWRRFATRFVDSPYVARARLGVVEAGALAYLLEARTEDLQRLRRDVEELRRLDAEPEAAAAARILAEAERAASP